MDIWVNLSWIGDFGVLSPESQRNYFIPDSSDKPHCKMSQPGIFCVLHNPQRDVEKVHFTTILDLDSICLHLRWRIRNGT
jgi:hypothetical protein